MLGGGHGWLQGQHGLMSDNLISARLVLANGTAISVSVNENPQLFWAIQGAGHNFGIVTSFESKIYEITAENKRWAYETLIFTGDKLEQVFEVVKSQIEDGGLPAELINMALWAFVPDVDLEKVSLTGSTFRNRTCLKMQIARHPRVFDLQWECSASGILQPVLEPRSNITYYKYNQFARSCIGLGFHQRGSVLLAQQYSLTSSDISRELQYRRAP